MTTHRSWFPFILVGLSAALLLVVIVLYRPSATPQRSTDDGAMVTPTGDEYEVLVQTIVSNYRVSSSSEVDKSAYDALLALRVPVAYKDVHVQLVLAFGQMAAGEDVAGQARLADVAQVYPWVSVIPASAITADE